MGFISRRRHNVSVGPVLFSGLLMSAALLAPTSAFAGTRSRCENSLSEGGWSVSMSSKFNELDAAALVGCIAVTGGAGTLACLGDAVQDLAATVGWDLLVDAVKNRGAVLGGPGGLQVQAGICSRNYPIALGAKGTDHYVYVRYRRNNGDSAPQGGGMLLQTGTALGETGANFSFVVGPNNDLLAIQRQGTGTGSTEVHGLAASSGYKSFSLHTGTPLEETDARFSFAAAPNGDLFAIKRAGTGTHSTELHVLTAASNYKSFSLHTGTPLEETPEGFAFAVASNGDLFAIKKRDTGTGRTEIHVLSAASGYQSFSLHTGTGLHETDDNFEFFVNGARDVVAVKKSATGTGHTEVHILSAASGYQAFSFQSATPLEETGDDFAFGLTAAGDLMAVKKAHTGTGSTEVHIVDLP